MSFWQTVTTSEWWTANIGQLVGAGIGAMSAYLIGAYQTRKQIELSQLPERINHAKVELPFIEKLEGLLEDLSLLLDEPSFRDSSNMRAPFQKVKNKWWQVLSNPRIARELDFLLQRLESVQSIIDNASDDEPQSITFMKRTIEDTREHVGRIFQGLMASEDSCKKLLGLENEKWRWSDRVKYRWTRVMGWFRRGEPPF